ncbi:hybrid sensor histidine kinase/response regulator [Candidatus Sumerlaeota bacterium]|nr:hybrid sensor histidine kinase/response regulator [Candidatus Sumerlaeota bacterium]
MSEDKQKPASGLEKFKVLIVDDAPKNIQLLGSNLRAEGYQVIPATSGAQALRAVELHAPDIILLDVMMPEMNGYEVLAKLRENGDWKDIPVIFVTALTDETDEAKGLDLGAVDYITKPIKMPIALARIRTHLQLKHARQQLADQNKKLLEAAQLKEDVDRITQHDMKTPLTSMLFVPQFLKSQDNITDQQIKMLNIAENACYQLLNMVNLSLDLYKMERKTYILDPQPVNIIPIFHKIFMELESLTSAKTATMKILIQGEPASDNDEFYALAEELLCYSMFSNLIKNAIEAAPNNSAVTIECETDPPSCTIKIHNQGAVPENIRDHFFEKYVTSGKQGGTGLGTYSARLMAETQNGGIAFESDESSGTTISIQLPV